MDDYEVAIIGGGIAGASCAYHLAEHGVTDLVVFEADQPASKTSGRAAGNITPYQLNASAQPQANDYCMTFYEELADQGDIQAHWSPSYVLARSASGSESVRNLHHEIETPSELLSAEDFGEVVPSITTNEIETVLAFNRGMHVDPHLVTTTLLDAARERGAEVQLERVTQIDAGESINFVIAGSERYAIKNLVLAAGIRSKSLAESIGLSVPLKPRISQIMILRPTSECNLPLITDPDLNGMYYRSEANNDVLVGGGVRDKESDPLAFETGARGWFVQQVADNASRIAPALADARVINSWVGVPSSTPDHHPLVGRTSIEGLYFCFGFNGEGIKLSAMAGRLVADALRERDSPFDPSPYQPRRFAGNEEFAIRSATDW